MRRPGDTTAILSRWVSMHPGGRVSPRERGDPRVSIYSVYALDRGRGNAYPGADQPVRAARRSTTRARTSTRAARTILEKQTPSQADPLEGRESVVRSRHRTRKEPP